MGNPNPTVAKLLERGVTKWSIHLFTGSHWNNVLGWSRGYYQPGPKYAPMLEEMLKLVEERQTVRFKELIAKQA